MAKREEVAKAKGNRIRTWKGLLAGECLRVRITTFAILFIVSTCMTFTQFGFIGIGYTGEYLGYALGLLAPICACSLLLGKGWGTLQGFLSGLVLFFHARFQPLDFLESYLVSFLNSFVLYGFIGFLLGILFAMALRNDPRGLRRVVYLFVVAFVISLLASILFMINSICDVVIKAAIDVANSGLTSSELADLSSVNLLSPDSMQAVANLGGFAVQIVVDLLFTFLVSLICDHQTIRYFDSRSFLGLRAVFGGRLFLAATLVFILVQAVSFTTITTSAEANASVHMEGEMGFVRDQIMANDAHAIQLMSAPEFESLSADTVSKLLGSDANERFIAGYGLEADGTIVVFLHDTLTYSNNPAYPVDANGPELMGKLRFERLESIAESGDMVSMLYDTRSPDDQASHEETLTGELGYMRALKSDYYTIMMAMPASMVFASRSSTMHWLTLIALVLAIVVYIAASLLLDKIVVTPIDRTNASLARITDGNLDEVVSEVGCVEFASLSAGINVTVDAMRGFIDDAERRMERDLSTAKAIQEGALPRTFPPFPEVDAFDLYASMDAAKSVGGDFYDFFLIDDHTLGFLIADVSGKGIPGALFMMAAKTEIENYLSTGMPPAEAIASANRRLCANNEAGMFVTVWAATLDYETGLLTYVNAGHNFPLLRHGVSGQWEWLKKKCGLFLGTFETAKYRQQTLTLATGDELVLYTDGVNEAFNVDEEEFGNDRLEAFLSDHAYLGPKLLVQRLRAEVAGWAEGAEQSDDITILALEYGATPHATGSITLPATIDSLAAANDLICSELERRLCPVSVLHKVEVALEELFVNVCRYSYAEEPEPGEVTVSYSYTGEPKSITVELRDEGIPFNPLTLKDPTKPASIQEAKIGGLGIFMVKNSMDDFSYVREGKANVVTFMKGW